MKKKTRSEVVELLSWWVEWADSKVLTPENEGIKARRIVAESRQLIARAKERKKKGRLWYVEWDREIQIEPRALWVGVAWVWTPKWDSFTDLLTFYVNILPVVHLRIRIFLDRSRHQS